MLDCLTCTSNGAEDSSSDTPDSSDSAFVTVNNALLASAVLRRRCATGLTITDRLTDISIPTSTQAEASSVILSTAWMSEHLVWRLRVCRHAGAVREESGAAGGRQSACRSAGDQNPPHSPSGDHSHSDEPRLVLCCRSQCYAFTGVHFIRVVPILALVSLHLSLC